MNTVIINGVQIDTFLNYIQFITSHDLKIEENLVDSILYIYFPEGTKSSELPFTVIEEKILEDTPVIKTHNFTHSINGMLIKKLVPKDYVINLTILSDIDKSYLIYGEDRCDMFISENISKEDYEGLLNSNPYIQVLHFADEFKIYNITNCLLDNVRQMNYVYTNDRTFKHKENYTRYIIDEPLVLYHLKNKLLEVLYDDGFDILKMNDQDELIEVPDVLSYEINNDYNPEGYVKKVRPVLNQLSQTSVNLSWTLKTTSISKAFDIKNKYLNLDLISNLTSIDVIDYKGNPYKVAIQWESIQGRLGDKNAIADEENNYYHQLTFSCTIHFHVLRDECLSNAVITKIHNVVRFSYDLDLDIDVNYHILSYKEYQDKLVKIVGYEAENEKSKTRR